jgi:hypothetical protein
MAEDPPPHPAHIASKAPRRDSETLSRNRAIRSTSRTSCASARKEHERYLDLYLSEYLSQKGNEGKLYSKSSDGQVKKY